MGMRRAWAPLRQVNKRAVEAREVCSVCRRCCFQQACRQAPLSQPPLACSRTAPRSRSGWRAWAAPPCLRVTRGGGDGQGAGHTCWAPCRRKSGCAREQAPHSSRTTHLRPRRWSARGCGFRGAPPPGRRARGTPTRSRCSVVAGGERRGSRESRAAQGEAAEVRSWGERRARSLAGAQPADSGRIASHLVGAVGGELPPGGPGADDRGPRALDRGAVIVKPVEHAGGACVAGGGGVLVRETVCVCVHSASVG